MITLTSSISATIADHTGIRSSIVLQGPAGGGVAISGAGRYQILALVTESGFPANFSIQNLTFTGGYTTGKGGALSINILSGELTISNSTLYGNYAAQGSSVYASAASVNITNTTFTGDTGPGGSLNLNESTLQLFGITLQQVTISGNASGLSYTPSIGADGGVFEVHNSIIAGNGTGNGCSACNEVTGSYTGSNPMLGPLQYNGSLLMTMLPQPGSPVIGIGGVTTADERGFPGKSAGDAGAVQTNYVTVNTLADSATDTSIGECGPGSGSCSLREAINLGNNNATGTDITFAPALTANTTQTVNGVTTYTPATIALAAQLPDVTGAIDIAGPGANVLQVSGMNQFNIVSVSDGGNLAFNGLTATAAGGTGGADGCALSNYGFLTLANMQVTATSTFYSVCNARNGGSLTAALVLANSTVSGGMNQPSAVYLSAPSEVVNSTISGNTTDVGAILIDYPTLIAGTTISNNTYIGGDTASSNLNFGATGSTVANSIVEGNFSAFGFPDTAGGTGYTDGGGNLINTSENYVNPGLAPLAYNGGTTQTMLPLPGSPAICTGLSSNQTEYGLPTDQRGATHSSAYCTASGNVDAGAVQTSYSALAFLQQPTNTTVNAAITPAPSVTVTENGIDAGGIPVTLTLASGEGTLAGAATQTTALQGPATFSGLSINQPGTGDTLSSELTITPSTYSGTADTLTATSSDFNVTSGATQLAFGTPPPATLAAGGNAGTVTVQEEGANGSVVPSANDTISLTVTPPNGQSAIYTSPAINGVATFNLSGVPLTVAGRYSYNASVTGLTSASFKETITVGPASMAAVVSGSGQSATLNTAFANPLKVQVTDAYGNQVGAGTTVSFAAPASGASAGLSSSTATTAANGMASVTATANGAAGTYSVTASVAGGPAPPASRSPTPWRRRR